MPGNAPQPDSAPLWNWTESLVAPTEASSKHVLVSLVSSSLAQVALVAGLALYHGSFHGLLMRFPPPPGAQSVASAASSPSFEVVAPEQNEDQPQELTTRIVTPLSPEESNRPELPTSRSIPTSPNGELQPANMHVDLAAVNETLVEQPQAAHSPPISRREDPAVPTPPPLESPNARRVPKAAKKMEVREEKIALPSSSASAPSREMDGAKSELPPRAIFNPSPDYPPEALAAKITGRVLLRVRVGGNGLVEDASIQKTSGHLSLDQAALAAVRRWRFEAVTNGGVSKPKEFAVPIRFVLEN